MQLHCVSDWQESGCLILVDLDNMEAASTAFVLLGLIQKKVMAGINASVPQVLQSLACFRSFPSFLSKEREQSAR